jgi:Domain of unknown function (DUF4157)
MRAAREALVPEAVRAALEQLLGERITQVKVIEHSWIARLHPRARATTRRARIYLRDSAREFFADPSLMLHEYCHVIHQWQTGRLTVLRYLRAWLRHGYRNNPFEIEARAFADANAGRLSALLSTATHPSSASRR